MKALKDTHKKWLLTASLASLLSFNLVATLMSPTGSSTADFASTAKSAKVVTKKGVMNAEFHSFDGGRKTRVVYKPSKKTSSEAGVSTADCEECNTEEAVLNLPFSSDMDEFIVAATDERNGAAPADSTEADEKAEAEAALKKARAAKAKKVAASKKEETEDVAAADSDDDDDDKDSKAEAKKKKAAAKSGDAKLAKLETKCSKESDKDVRTQCYGNGLARLLGDDSEVSEKAAMKTWQSRIRTGMVAGLLNTKNKTTNDLAKELLNKMLTDINPEFQVLRKNIVLAATQAVSEAYQKAQEIGASVDFAQNPQVQMAYEAQIQKARLLRASLGEALLLDGSEDKLMVKQGYALPTKAINDALSKYKPYPALEPITDSVYEEGLKLPGSVAQKTAGLPGQPGAKTAAAHQADLQRLKINTRGNPLPTNKTGDGAPEIQSGASGSNTGSITPIGGPAGAGGVPNANRQMRPAGNGAMVPGAPGAPGAIPTRRF